MKQKRDAQGRFVKMHLTREEYEAKIAELEEKIESIAFRASIANNNASLWKNNYHTEKERFEVAKELVNELGLILGSTLSNLACVVNPEVIVVGGGVSKAGKILIMQSPKMDLPKCPVRFI